MVLISFSSRCCCSQTSHNREAPGCISIRSMITLPCVTSYVRLFVCSLAGLRFFNLRDRLTAHAISRLLHLLSRFFLLQCFARKDWLCLRPFVCCCAPLGPVHSTSSLFVLQNTDGTKTEYRVWNPFRSKIAASVLGGVENIWIGPGQKVLYLGAASGTSVSHVSDLVGPVRITSVPPPIRPDICAAPCPDQCCASTLLRFLCRLSIRSADWLGLRSGVFAPQRPRSDQHG